MPSFLKNLIFGILLTGVISCGSGCAVLPPMGKSLGTMWPGKKEVPHEAPGNPVVKVISIWQPGSGIDPEGKSSRGFSGQIMFFTAREQAISTIEGGATIYVFDDQGTIEQQVKPIHIWEFKPEVWKALRVDSPMGPTYQVFIPYTRSGSHEANCTLRVKYQPLNGGSVSSEMVNVTLEGTKNHVAEKLKSEDLPKAMEEFIDEESGEQNESQESLEPTQRPSFRPKKVNSVPLDEAERERILREFQDQGDSRSLLREQDSGSHLLNSGGHLLEEEEEADISPSERFGMKPRLHSGIDDWAGDAGEERENLSQGRIRQVTWASEEPESVDQKNELRPRSSTREVRRNKSETDRSTGGRRSFQVHTIPLN